MNLPVEDLVAKNGERTTEQISPISVIYSHVTQEESLVHIDPEKLASVIEKVTGGKVKPQRFIVSDSLAPFSGVTNPTSNTVEINTHYLVDEISRLRPVIESLLSEKELTTAQHWQKKLTRMFGDIFYRYLLPISWPYIGLRKPEFFSGNNERRKNYIKVAMQGYFVAKDGSHIAVEKERAAKLLEKIFISAFHRNIAGTLAHEFQHTQNKKLRIGYLLGVVIPAGITAGLTEIGMVNPDSAAALAGPMMFLCSMMVRRVDEQSAFDAQAAHAADFQQAVTINPEALSKALLGQHEDE